MANNYLIMLSGNVVEHRPLAGKIQGKSRNQETSQRLEGDLSKSLGIQAEEALTGQMWKILSIRKNTVVVKGNNPSNREKNWWVSIDDWKRGLTFVIVQLLSHVWLCYPVDCSTPGFPVLHSLLEFAQAHIHWVGDAIQPSHPLSHPSPCCCYWHTS